LDTFKLTDTIKAVKIEATPKIIKSQKYSQLHDFYSPLLTDRQNACFTMHYSEDFSLAEIGNTLGITPQAVADQIKRTVVILQRHEKKLGLAQNWQKQQSQISKIIDSLSELTEKGYSLDKIEQIKSMVSEL